MQIPNISEEWKNRGRKKWLKIEHKNSGIFQ